MSLDHPICDALLGDGDGSAGGNSKLGSLDDVTKSKLLALREKLAKPDASFGIDAEKEGVPLGLHVRNPLTGQ